MLSSNIEQRKEHEALFKIQRWVRTVLSSGKAKI
jgi:hypothetical protein